jgi:predicted kinase
MLIVFGGLPGTGKTTVARALAQRLKAVHIRVDTIEQAVRSCDVLKADVGPAGYAAAMASWRIICALAGRSSPTR